MKMGGKLSLGMLQTMTALQPKFHNFTLARDESLTKAMLMGISTLSREFLMKTLFFGSVTSVENI